MSPTVKRGTGQRPSARARRRLARRDLDHPRRDVEPDDRRAARVSLERDVAGAAREIEDAIALLQRRLPHQPPFPRAIAAERQHDGDEVVAIGDGRKERADVAPLLLGAGERVGQLHEDTLQDSLAVLGSLDSQPRCSLESALRALRGAPSTCTVDLIA